MMDIANQVRELFQVRRNRAIVLAIAVLIILSVIQINHLQVTSPMSELFNGSLNRRDIERIELAFGNANLNDFQIQDNRIIVPQQRRSEYLKAITEQNAIPQHLRTEPKEAEAVSMFMSHSQQKSLSRQRKKEQIRNMVMRLPFVEQAWFEMDIADSRSAFDAAAQTAVISIEPAEEIILDSVQVDTITRIIKGAIAGINADQIQVIDIHSGYAHDGDHADAEQVTNVKGLPALEQQNYFENRIRRSLSDLPGAAVAVQVDIVEIPAQPQTFAQPIPVAPAVSRQSPKLVAGTNGFASIYDTEPVEVPMAAPVIPVSFSQPTYATKVKVNVAVPQSLVESRIIAKPGLKKSNLRTSGLQLAFEDLESEITQRVSALLPAESGMSRGYSPVSVRLVKSAPLTAVTWNDKLHKMVVRYWPSAAVLLIGLVLISTMQRSERHRERIAAETESLNADILSINTSLESRTREADENDHRFAESEEVARRDAEIRLNQMVEKNPESTQRVLESWIKDAA